MHFFPHNSTTVSEQTNFALESKGTRTQTFIWKIVKQGEKAWFALFCFYYSTQSTLIL